MEYKPYEPRRPSGNPEGKLAPKTARSKGKRFANTAKRSIIPAVAIIAAVVVVAVLAAIAWVRPQATPMRPDPTVPAQATTARLDAYTAFRAKYGPWHIADNDIVATNVAILKQNGTREDSVRSIAIDASWAPATQMVDFRATAREGSTIRVQTQQGAVYTLSQDQAFVIEGRPETLYGVTATLQFVQTNS